MLYDQQTSRTSGAEPFLIQHGVRKGDVLSTLPFNATLEMVMRRWKTKLGEHGRKITSNNDLERLTHVRFAGDLIIVSLSQPHLERSLAYGRNQFAYSRGRGARDAILLLVLSWLTSMARGYKVALYCSDVSGAFDKIAANLLIRKLQQRGLPQHIVKLLGSWFDTRTAKVIVGVNCSKQISIGLPRNCLGTLPLELLFSQRLRSNRQMRFQGNRGRRRY